MTNDRIELHNDSHYSGDLSYLFGYDIAREAKRHECTAIAITDLNSVYSYCEAETELAKRNISMIYGITISCVDTEDRYDVVLLAKDIIGRDNIFRLVELMHQNDPMLGHAVTRNQLDTHRKGTLMGAAAHNGQLVRAVQHRRNQRYLDLITSDYDYIEFVPEPYDISAEIFQLAQKHDIPLCTVQHAVLREKNEPAEYHAYCALNEYYRTDMKPAYWRSAAEVEEEIKTLYVLPDERGAAQRTIFEAPQKIAAQIQQIPPVSSLLTEGQEQWHREAMPTLREVVDAAIREKFGANCPTAVRERIEAELTLIDDYHAAPIFLYLSTLEAARRELDTGMVSGAGVNSELLHLWGLSEPDPMPRHIWCPKCGHWEEVELEIGAAVHCPCCRQNVVASGIELPVESLHGVLINGGSFEFRGSNKSVESLQSKFQEFISATIFQEPLCMVNETNSGALDVQIAEDYLKRDPELSDAMRDNGRFFYYVGLRKPCEDEAASPYDWCFCPGNSSSFLQHLPTYQVDRNIYRLMIRTCYKTAVPRIRAILHDGFDLLAACESAIKIKPDKTAIYGPEIYQKILAMASDETEKDSAVAQACRAFGSNMYSEPELFFNDGVSQNIHREILKLMPLRNYEDLCRIINISHGAGAWFGNAQELLEHGMVSPEQVITCREDVMEYLIRRGCKREMAFEIMEYVRKGRASSTKTEKPQFLAHHWDALRECGAEDWFIESCQKIEYLFPRGHSAAMAAGLAKLIWYVIHAPEETERVFAEVLDDRED